MTVRAEDDSFKDTRKVDDLTFKQWYKRVDQIVSGIAGLGIDDLADGPSWDSWNDGLTPKDYAIQQLEDEGFPFEDFAGD